LWEKSYLSQSGFKKSSTDPVYYYKYLELNENQSNTSKEEKLFLQLKEIMEFESIKIRKVTTISSLSLAQSMSNYRKFTIERMISSPGVFKSQNWKSKSNQPLRSMTLEHLHRQLLNFEWNKDLKIEDCPVLTFAHATSLQKAKNIIDKQIYILTS